MSDAPTPLPPSGHDNLLQARIEADRQAGQPINKIALIKHLREASGLGLKAAKDAVESFGYRHQIPELQPGRAGAGCTFAILLLIGAIAALVLGFHSASGGQAW